MKCTLFISDTEYELQQQIEEEEFEKSGPSTPRVFLNSSDESDPIGSAHAFLALDQPASHSNKKQEPLEK